MPNELLNTKEVAGYLDINEKQVYALIKARRIPATRVTGKWLFPKALIDEWIRSQAGEALQEARRKSTRIEGALLAAGSNDPVLDMLLASLKAAHPDFYVFTASTGSADGLRALGNGYTDLAWTHLIDPESGEYNTPAALAPHLQGAGWVVVHLFNREIGLVAAKGNPLEIRGFDDLLRIRPRIVNRQPGAGTRILLDYQIKKANLSPDSLPGYDREVFTHMDVGLAVLTGEADTGIASTAVARLLGLHMATLATESFDMVLRKATFFSRGVQAFLEGLQSRSFQQNVEKLGGYDFQRAGLVLHTIDPERS
ncbi:MAG: DNA-binding protein [Deltaproteobacteria bacterium HGW-Deltaproteobacteria-19]|jgi:excisionase family DNA binding protein|nr:MAG: DNA-binding protein [Deltaproteobacteria bacterium HGW-Deltaproteobacteria-19]